MRSRTGNARTRSGGLAVALGTTLASGAFAVALHWVPQATGLERGAFAAAGAVTWVIPAGAHAAGAGGTNWRTDIEIHNAGATQVSYTLALLRRDQDNGSPSAQSFTLGPGLAARYPDALWQLFSFSGAGAIKLETTGGPLVVTSRTYNLLGSGNPLGLPSGSTFGQFVAGAVLDGAIAYGQTGRIIQINHSPNPSAGKTTGFRTNIGAVNASSVSAEVVVELFANDGYRLGEVRRTLRAWEYVQWDRVFELVTTAPLADGYAITRTTTSGGRFFAYASVVDNATGDPIFIPAQPAGVVPTPSPSPSPSPSPTTPPPTPTVPPGAVTLQPGPGSNAGGDQGSGSAGKDTTIYKGGPATNYGTGAAFFIDDNEGTGCYNDSSTAMGLLRFDVSSLPATAATAKLRLYCTRALASTLGYVPVDLFRLDSDWNEMTATYSNRPVRGPLVTTVTVFDEPAGLGWYEWDITSLYNQWRSGAVANHGLEIHGFTCKANASHDRHFATSDFTDHAALRPMLVVVPGSAPPAVNANLKPYKPTGWESPVVPDYEAGTRSSSFLSSYMNTYVDWAVANYGPDDVTTRVDYELRLDGQRVTGWYTDGIRAGYYVSVDDFVIPYDTIPPGSHTLTIVADSGNDVGETDENDNSWGSNWEWTTILFAPPDGTTGSERTSPAEIVSRLEPRPMVAVGNARQAAAASGSIYVPASAHASGAGGTNWRTDLEVHNPGPGQASYTVALLKRDSDNSAPTTKSYTLAAGRVTRFVDLLAAEFSFSGTAALRITPTSGAVLVTSRTYNLLGTGNSLGLPEGSTFGQYVPGLAESGAIAFGEEGRIIQLSHAPGTAAGTYRTNLGVVNVTGVSCAAAVTLYGSNGVRYGEVTKTLRPYEYVQWDKVFEQVTGGAVSDGFAIVRTTTSGGRFFAYASVVDNATGDPVLVPAVKVIGGAIPPTPTATVPPTPGGGGVITGPGGTSVTLPGQTSPGTPVTLTSGNGSALAKSGETLVSTVIKATVGGEGAVCGSGPFVVKIPVTGTVSDPTKVLLKVQTNVGPVYPVAGIYDPSSKLFTAELQGLWNGWNLGVVTSTSLSIATSQDPEAGAMGWVTPTDWQSCAWQANVHSAAIPTAFRDEVLAAVKASCEHLRGAEFRSPKLWLDPRLNPRARIVHVVTGSGANDPTTSFKYKTAEESVAFSLAGYNDEQMHSLGQLYFNYDQLQQLAAQGVSWTKGHVAIHELLHAVQKGYDIRTRIYDVSGFTMNDLKWLSEGTATVVGMTYQSNLNGIYGGEVTVRPEEPPHLLDDIVLQWFHDAYAVQDFFAYVAKRYNGGSFRDLRWMYQHLSDVTDGQFGRDTMSYRALYRRGMNSHYMLALGETLPEVYTEFAVDRAYRHNEPALLRTADRALKKNSLDWTVFNDITPWDIAEEPVLDSEQDGGLQYGVEPLATWAISATVPEAARDAGSLSITITVDGAVVSRDEVRIFVFREKDEVMQLDGELEVTDISAPVDVPVAEDTETLTILVVNGSVENRDAHVTLSVQPFNFYSSGATRYYNPCSKPEGCSGSCAVTCDDEEGGHCEWVSGLVWDGSKFTVGDETTTIEGELAADQKSLVSLKWTFLGTMYLHLANLPLDPSRSSADVLVFAASGTDAAQYVVTAKKVFLCDVEGVTDGIDYTKTVQLEAWLAR